MLSHAQAKVLVDSLPAVANSPTPEKLSLLTRGVAWLESNYGAGWKGAGAGSHNWGAITGSYNGQSFRYEDSRWDAKTNAVVKYTTSFRAYPDDRSGAEDLARLLASKYPAAIAAAPNWPAVSAAMYGYYLGTTERASAIDSHAKRLTAAVQSITQATGEHISTPAQIPMWGLVLGGSALLWYLRKGQL